MSFDQETRRALARMVAACRGALKEDVTDQLQRVYGLHPDSTSLPLERLSHLTEDELAAARRLRELLDHFAAGSAGPTPERCRAAYGRMVLEISFTILNRLAALRLCEERGLVVECVRKGAASDGFRVFESIGGGELGPRYDAYRAFLECMFDELALDLGVLFDRSTPQSVVFPSERCLEDVLGLLNDPALAHLWAADETIGWIYQYFNPKQERDAMRKASRSPRNTRELAARNQFFTPRYVVEFLTDNTLGRIWYEMLKGRTALKDVCRYLMRRPAEVFLDPGETPPETAQSTDSVSREDLVKRPAYVEHRPKRDPRELRVLDPACGSGHFLLYAFDLFERIYEEAWCDPDLGPALWEAAGLRTADAGMPDRLLRAAQDDSLALLRRMVPRWILADNLHGIDIDPRCVQITALALWLRAQRTYQRLGLKPAERPRITKSNIVCAEPMPGERELLEEFLKGLRADRLESLLARISAPPEGMIVRATRAMAESLCELIRTVWVTMRLAGEAGSLLKIEEEIQEAVAQGQREWSEKLPLFRVTEMGLGPNRRDAYVPTAPGEQQTFWDIAERLVILALQDYAQSVSNGKAGARRLFSEDAAHGFAFVDMCRKRFDVLLMNPPFGASSKGSKDYIEDHYGRTKGDLLTNFVERTLGLARSDGRVGAISSRTPFFLGSFAKLRNEVFGRDGHVEYMADLGDGVLEAMVETAIYVLSKDGNRPAGPLFLRLLIEADKGAALHELVGEFRAGTVSERMFIIDPAEFSRLPGSPYAYWVSGKTIQTLGGFPSLEGSKAFIRVGMQTGDDFRFLRLLWEIPPQLIAPAPIAVGSADQAVRYRCLQDLSSGKVWVAFSKTEAASPWFSPITLVANWARNGKELRNFTSREGKLRSALRSETEYFKPGFSYMLRSTRLVPYLVPAGIMPTAGRAQIFPLEGEEYSVLGICASNIGSAVVRFGGECFARPKYQAGMVQTLPACEFRPETVLEVKRIVDDQVNRRRSVVQGYEPYQEFTVPAWVREGRDESTAWNLYSLLGRRLEEDVARDFGLGREQLAELERDIREAVEIRVNAGQGDAEEDVDAPADSEEDAAEEEATVELISQTPEEKAIGLFSYSVGCALGRWDVRMARDQSLAPRLPDPFDPLPVCPPGMLVGSDGLPPKPQGIASEEWLRSRPSANALPPESSVPNPTIADETYPLRVSWDGILVDDAGYEGGQLHREDIVRRVREVLDLLWGTQAVATEQEVCGVLGVADPREYFHKASGFFQDHLDRYSKSRRKAPIYWPLSTGSGSYTVWVYYHRLTDQTLYTVVNRYLDQKIADVERGLLRIENEMKGASGSASARLRDRVGDGRALLAELQEMREELLRVAALPYKPDLNDGVIINAAPLHRLFRHRQWANDTEGCWRKLEQGEYDWAHMAYTIWPDRVREVCKKDRSIAIAHGLEDICEVKPPGEKKRRGRSAGKGRKHGAEKGLFDGPS